MKTPRLAPAAFAAAATLILASCYTDPYNPGYGDSYAYSGGGVTFVQTSNSRWFYDPGVRCYFDRTRNCYYDPYLYGYYPVGYCPRPIYNAPHPYGWNGSGICPVPRGVRNQRIERYDNRVALLRERNYRWADQVRVRDDASVGDWQRRQVRAASNFDGQTVGRQLPNQGDPQNRGNRAERRPQSGSDERYGQRQPAADPSYQGRQAPLAPNSFGTRQPGFNPAAAQAPSRGGDRAARGTAGMIRPEPRQPSPPPAAPPRQTPAREAAPAPSYSPPAAAPGRQVPSRQPASPRAPGRPLPDQA